MCELWYVVLERPNEFAHAYAHDDLHARADARARGGPRVAA